MTSNVQDSVKEYYGEILQGSDDLQTNACCTDTAMPDYLKSVLSKVPDEVLARYYGCGLVAPEQLQGMRILDLGSGSGRDCYALAAMVGESGYVVGVDMTDDQLAVANRHIDEYTQTLGYAKPNLEFRKGYIEKLDELGLDDDSFDIIISNCVINLSPDKAAVLAEAQRLLKPGGEMYFSDVYADKRVPEDLRNDPVLYGECLGGALYWNDFLNLAKGAGFADPRLVESRRLTIDNPKIEATIGHIKFYSATYRLFNIESLEPACEDYGQAVVYKGTVVNHSQNFALDNHHFIETGKVFPVCGNTYRMLNESRFSEHFEYIGNWDTHYGIFAGCGTVIPFEEGAPTTGADGSSGSCC